MIRLPFLRLSQLTWGISETSITLKENAGLAACRIFVPNTDSIGLEKTFPNAAQFDIQGLHTDSKPRLLKCGCVFSCGGRAVVNLLRGD